MALRLLATIDGDQTRLAVRAGKTVLGSDPSCDLVLSHPSVSRRHAQLEVEGATITLEDLESSNGTYLGPRRIRRERVAPGDRLRFGRVTAVIEEVADRDLEAGVRLPQGRRGAVAAAVVEAASTASLEPVEAFALDHLPRLLADLDAGASVPDMSRKVGSALYRALPAASLELAQATRTGELSLFEARFAESEAGASVQEETREGDLILRLGFARAKLHEVYRPLVIAALRLVKLAGRSSGPAETPRTEDRLAPPVPDPASLEPRVVRIYEDAAKVARGDVGVLITGESGTGKEVLARYLHAASERRDGPFVALNCAALPQDLLEAELFGIERGVATGVDSRPGKFELADGGTLFLDEVGDMALPTQPRILRVLQEKMVHRLGGRDARPARTRVVAATNRNIDEMIAAGRFREDLYHRFATWVVHLPPLRQRPADIANLAAHFLEREAQARGLRVAGISKAALDALRGYGWPGNIRELENEMARCVLFLEDGELLDTARLGPAIRAGGGPPGGKSLADALAAAERKAILVAFDEERDVGSVCVRLGISRATLYRRLKALEIDPERAR